MLYSEGKKGLRLFTLWYSVFEDFIIRLVNSGKIDDIGVVGYDGKPDILLLLQSHYDLRSYDRFTEEFDKEGGYIKDNLVRRALAAIDARRKYWWEVNDLRDRLEQKR